MGFKNFPGNSFERAFSLCLIVYVGKFHAVADDFNKFEYCLNTSPTSETRTHTHTNKELNKIIEYS